MRTKRGKPARLLLAVLALAAAVPAAYQGTSLAAPDRRADLQAAEERLMELEREFESVEDAQA